MRPSCSATMALAVMTRAICLNFEAHIIVLLPDGNSLTPLFPDNFSILSSHDISLPLHHAYPHSLQEGLSDNCRDETLARRARHDSPCRDTWSDWRGSPLYLQSSFSFYVLMSAAKIQQFFESPKFLVTKLVVSPISFAHGVIAESLSHSYGLYPCCQTVSTPSQKL